ncbi:hypothetical protein TNCV_814021 [Trichonephila clavipes]|nr:hypothetical protein TNCV_814021 [Trichonephila clavipes]
MKAYNKLVTSHRQFRHPDSPSGREVAKSSNNPRSPNLEVVQLSPESFLCEFSGAIFSFSQITRYPVIAC